MDVRARFLCAVRALSLPRGRVLVAVSGGADSVALTRLFASVADELSLTLFAAHMEHGIRGVESRRDCQFVEELCRKLAIPLTVRHVDVPAQARANAEGLETCARRLRHAFLEETRAALDADCIALAHHLNDQAETVLMHLLRGSGLSGAAAMRPSNGRVARPLIGLERREIEEYLSGLGQTYCIDASNAVCDNPRNALRHEVFPALTAIYPRAAHALGRFAAIAADEDDFLSAAADAAWAQHAQRYGGITIIRDADALHPALLRRLIRRAAPRLGFEDVERLRLAGGKTQLTGQMNGFRTGNALYLLPPLADPAPVALPDVGSCVLPGLCRLTVAPAAPVPVRDDPFTQVVPARVLPGTCLRTRRQGDFIRPFGLRGQRKSLSDYLTDRKFPLPLRARLPLLARGSEILWAAGVGLSEACRVSGQDEARILNLTINTL